MGGKPSTTPQFKVPLFITSSSLSALAVEKVPIAAIEATTNEIFFINFINSP
jgi:hypothetical protein